MAEGTRSLEKSRCTTCAKSKQVTPCPGDKGQRLQTGQYLGEQLKPQAKHLQGNQCNLDFNLHLKNVNRNLKAKSKNSQVSNVKLQDLDFFFGGDIEVGRRNLQSELWIQLKKSWF